MTDVRLRWHGDQVEQVTRSVLRGRMNRAGGVARDILMKVVSSRRRSRPGEPPGRDTGRLHRSMRSETRSQHGRKGGPLVLRLRVRDRKAHLLEYGTKRMKARPFFRRTVTTFARGRWPAILAGR